MKKKLSLSWTVVLSVVLVYVLFVLFYPPPWRLAQRIVKNPDADGILLAHDAPTLDAIIHARPFRQTSTVAVPNGTKGRILHSKLLRDGILVEPYPADSAALYRDHAEEVALFEVTEGPHRGAIGWVKLVLLQPAHRYL
jgi:hypothetical protein